MLKQVITSTTILTCLIYSNVARSQDLNLDISHLIIASEIKYDLPRGLLEAIVRTESSGNHKATNHNDGNSAQKSAGLQIKSYGLMQLQLDTAHLVQRIKAGKNVVFLKKGQKLPKTTKAIEYYVDGHDLLNPEINIDYGAAYLAWLLKNSKNDVALALTCWNVGPNSKICKGKRYYGEYVGKVLNNFVIVKGLEQ